MIQETDKNRDPITGTWWIGITGKDYESWSVGFNPVGGGLSIRLDRGIPCEGHRQIFTAHCTNTPEIEDVEFVIKEYKDEWGEAVEAFIALLNAYPKTLKCKSSIKETKWPSREHIASIFCVDLIAEIAQRAEDHFCDRVG